MCVCVGGWGKGMPFMRDTRSLCIINSCFDQNNYMGSRWASTYDPIIYLNSPVPFNWSFETRLCFVVARFVWIRESVTLNYVIVVWMEKQKTHI